MKVLLLLTFGNVISLLGADCDLRVIVRNYDGSPGRGALVSVITDTGEKLAQTTAEKGIAEFCDVGLQTFSVVVGYDSCGQVYVRRLTTSYAETLEVPIYYHQCHGFRIFTTCDVMLRLKDEQGKRIGGAEVDTGGHPLHHSDRYGRIRFPVFVGWTKDINVKVTGFRPESVPIACWSGGNVIEKTVTLKKNIGIAAPAQ